MKHLTKHEGFDAFKSAVNSLAKPQVALINEGGKKFMGYAKENGDYDTHLQGSKVKCQLLDGATHPGDIAYWNGTQIRFKNYEDWTGEEGTAIGIVVVPNTHTDDGTSRIMSLCNMSLQTPETGSLATGGTQGDTAMYWGGYGVDLSLPNLNTVPVIDPETGTSAGTMDWGYLPSDRFTEGTLSKDGITRYSASERYMPSPYNADGSKNPEYNKYACADMDGRANQKVIMAAVTADISGVIPNSYAAGNYPPASACSRFHTDGTAAGDWYLPAAGEIGYINVRIALINRALAKVGASKAIQVGFTDSILGTWMWSSSAYSAKYARYLHCLYSRLNFPSKNYISNGIRVRAFCAV